MKWSTYLEFMSYGNPSSSGDPDIMGTYIGISIPMKWIDDHATRWVNNPTFGSWRNMDGCNIVCVRLSIWSRHANGILWLVHLVNPYMLFRFLDIADNALADNFAH